MNCGLNMEHKLREMLLEDLELVLRWRNSESIRENMYNYDLITNSEHSEWYQRESTNPSTRLMIFELEGVPSGVVIFSSICKKNSLATWAFYSGDAKVRGVGTMMERLALAYAFNELELDRLECEVLEFNEPVARFHKKFGFVEEGRKRSAYKKRGEVYDIIQLAILKQDYIRTINSATENYLSKSFKKNVMIDAELITAFSELSGDKNPVHLLDSEAVKAGFERRISHGMLAGSLFSSIFSEEIPGPGTIYLEQSLRFLSPVLIDTEVEVVVKVISQVGRKILVDTQIISNGVICIVGEATLLVPKK
jgi:UDP-4-amino-4,6-dideoxy-N-acetyl-beta-L-altrosamine N-acetyltransferase